MVWYNQFCGTFLAYFILFHSFLFCDCGYACALFWFYNIIYPFSIIVYEHVDSLHIFTFEIYWKTAYSILPAIANHWTTTVSFICFSLAWYHTQILLPSVYYLNTIWTRKCYTSGLNYICLLYTCHILHKLFYHV